MQKYLRRHLQEDSPKQQDVGRHAQGGEYFAAGVGGAITGRGADLLIIDDPHSEQDAMSKVALRSQPMSGTHQDLVNVCSLVVK